MNLYNTLIIAAILLLATLATIPHILEMRKRREISATNRTAWVNSVAVEIARIQDCPCDKETLEWADKIAVEYYDPAIKDMDKPPKPRVAAYSAIERTWN